MKCVLTEGCTNEGTCKASCTVVHIGVYSYSGKLLHIRTQMLVLECMYCMYVHK